MSDEAPEVHALANPEGQRSSCSFSIIVDDCDAAFAQATAAGAEVLDAPADQFYGMRTSQVADPFGYRWHLCQPQEELTPEEIENRAKELFAG
ncbi:MAG: VOC family protein, partial [Verrucomicrobiota bacterium]